MATPGRLFRTAAISGTLLLAAGLTAPPGSAAPANRQTISWSPCTENPNAQCGTVTVPIDWSRPRAGTVDIAVARLPATDQAHKIGSLLINPGGPGGSGVDFAEQDPFSAAVHARFDIVGFDPRGVARSHPVQCPADLENAAPSIYPKTEQQYDAVLAFNRQLTNACRDLTGPLFDHVDTASVARDMDAIRAALGESKISYYGVSYGTLLGTTYAELFPHRIRAMTIDSALDHTVTSPRSFITTTAGGPEAGYRQFAEWCAATSACALHGQDAIAVLDDLMAKADAGTLVVGGQQVMPEDISALIQSDMYSPARSWPGLATALKQAESSSAAPKAQPQVVDDPFAAVFCADWALPLRHGFAELSRDKAAARRVAPHTRLNPLGWVSVVGCQNTGINVSNPQHEYDIHGVPPILLTNSVADPATAYPWAVGDSHHIRQTTLVTYDGTGHGDYFNSMCVRQTIDDYLLALRVPPRGTHCAAEPPSGTEPQAVVHAERAGGF